MSNCPINTVARVTGSFGTRKSLCRDSGSLKWSVYVFFPWMNNGVVDGRQLHNTSIEMNNLNAAWKAIWQIFDNICFAQRAWNASIFVAKQRESSLQTCAQSSGKKKRHTWRQSFLRKFAVHLRRFWPWNKAAQPRVIRNSDSEHFSTSRSQTHQNKEAQKPTLLIQIKPHNPWLR